MSNKVSGNFSVSTVAAAIVIIDDLIDAAFAIGTPTILIVNLSMDIAADTGDTVTWTATMSMRARAYHSSTVNTTMKTNLLAFITEWEDMVTAAGDYDEVTNVKGGISVEPIE